MLKEAATKHFGSQHAIAIALGVSDSAVSQWKEIIPEKAAFKLQAITNGELKYMAELYKKAA